VSGAADDNRFDFTWIIEHRLAACRYPGADPAYRYLRAAGIGLLINLHADPHPSGLLARYGLRELHMPVVDFMAPTLDQVARAIGAIDESFRSGERVAVHCAYGLGRTGTLVACYLVHTGAAADDAIVRVRQLRPGSIETLAQVNVINEYAARLSG